MHDRLARLLAERALKVLAVVSREVVARHGLAAIFVYPLQHLVAGGVPETGEQRDKLPPEWRGGLVLEDDSGELREGADLLQRSGSVTRSPFWCLMCFGVAHLSLIAHETLRDGINLPTHNLSAPMPPCRLHVRSSGIRDSPGKGAPDGR